MALSGGAAARFTSLEEGLGSVMKRNMVFAITLCLATSTAASAATLFFDFGSVNNPTAGNYNNVNPTQAPIANAIDSTGAPTSIGLATSGFNELGPNTGGTQSPTGPASIFDVEATRDNLFGHSSDFNAGGSRRPGLLTFSGLDGSGLTSYSFSIFASRLGGTNNRETEYAVAGLNGGSAFLNAADNTSNVVSVPSIIPTAGGVITITVDEGPNNDTGADLFFYLGAMKIETSTIPEPATFGLLALAGLAFTLQRRRSS